MVLCRKRSLHDLIPAYVKKIFSARSHAGALVVIHKSTDADTLQPGGLLAISRGLSEATPPVGIGHRIRPRRGRRNLPTNLGYFPKMLQMLGSGCWYSRPHRKNYDPSGVDIFFGLPSGGVASLNP